MKEKWETPSADFVKMRWIWFRVNQIFLKYNIFYFLQIQNFFQIESEQYKGMALAYCLKSFVELMEHGILLWDVVEAPFINKVASYVNNQAIAIDPQVIKASLSILENIVMNSSVKCGQVEKEITFPNLVKHLQNMNPQIQQNAIALINALILKADMTKRKAVAATLQCKQIRNVFLINVIQSTGHVSVLY